MLRCRQCARATTEGQSLPQQHFEDDHPVIIEETKEPIVIQNRIKQRHLLAPGISSSFTESSQIGAEKYFGHAMNIGPPQDVIVEEDEGGNNF